MQIWHNLELRSLAHLLVAASRDYKPAARRHVAVTQEPAPKHQPCAGRDTVALAATSPAPTPACGDRMAREVCPDWLRMIVDNRNG